MGKACAVGEAVNPLLPEHLSLCLSPEPAPAVVQLPLPRHQAQLLGGPVVGVRGRAGMNLVILRGTLWVWQHLKQMVLATAPVG